MGCLFSHKSRMIKEYGMAITFRATVKRRTSDADKASTITFDVPYQDYDSVSQAAKIEGVVFITILTEREVDA